MTYLAVSFDTLQQFDAVHYWHHDICHHDIEVLLQQHLHCRLAIGTGLYLEILVQFALDVKSYLGVVVHGKHTYVLAGAVGCRCCRRYRLFTYLAGLQVLFPLGQHYGEDAAMLAVSAVGCSDGSLVHLDDRAADVQAESCSCAFLSLLVMSLIESVEEPCRVFVAESRSVVDDAYACLRTVAVGILLAHHYLHLASLVNEFERVGYEIANHLLEVGVVNVCHHGACCPLLHLQRDIPLLRIILEHRAHGTYELGEVGLLAFQSHHVVVYLTLVENLVDKRKQSLCVAVDGVDGRGSLCLLFFSALFSTVDGTQFAQRRHDER